MRWDKGLTHALRGLAAALLLPLAPAQAAPPPPPPQQQGTPGGQTATPPGLAARNIQAPGETVEGDSATVTLRTFDAPLTITKIMVSDLVGTQDSANHSRDAGLVQLAPDCAKILQKESDCQFKASLSPDLPAGSYKATITIVSPRTAENVTVKFERRAPMKLALTVLGAGLLVGAVVAYWLGGTRDHAVRAVRVKRVRKALRPEGDLGYPALRLLIVALGALTRNWERDIHLVADAQVDELEKRPKQLEYLRRAIGQTPANAALTAAMRDVAEAMAPLPDGTLAAVDTALFQKVKAAAQPAAAIEADFPVVAPVLPFTVGSSLASALLVFRFVEHLIALLLALVFAAIAINAFYFKDPTWGSPGDMIGLFLVGFGAYAGSLSGVTTFLGRGKTLSW